MLPDKRVAFDNVAYTYAGVRPLSFEPGRSASEGLARAQGDPGGAGRALPLGHRHQADLLPQPGRGRGRPGDARARAAGEASRTARAHPRRHRRGGRQDRGAGLDGRLRRDGGHRALPCDAQDAGGDLRPGLSARARAGRASCPTASSASARAIPRSWPSSTTRWARSWRCRCRTCSCAAPGIGQSRCQGLDCAEPIAARMAELARLVAAPARRRARGLLPARGAEPAVPAPLMARLARGVGARSSPSRWLLLARARRRARPTTHGCSAAGS